MTWRQTTAETDYTSGRLEWAGGGDPDVYTKPGRLTQVTLRTDNLRPADDCKSVLVDVYYSVREMSRNNTFLQWRGTASLPIPVDAQKGVTLQIMDVRNFDKSWYVRGQVHDSIEVPNVTDSPIVPGSTYRIDGVGPDQSNAQINLHLRVPIAYEDVA